MKAREMSGESIWRRRLAVVYIAMRSIDGVQVNSEDAGWMKELVWPSIAVNKVESDGVFEAISGEAAFNQRRDPSRSKKAGDDWGWNGSNSMLFPAVGFQPLSIAFMVDRRCSRGYDRK